MNTDNTDQVQMRGKHDDLTERVIGVFYDVYNELGYGFLESVYREAMGLALTQSGLRVETEVPVPVSFRGVVVGIFRADLVVNGCLLVELKAVEQRFDNMRRRRCITFGLPRLKLLC
jgi:GxxExxY protein